MKRFLPIAAVVMVLVVIAAIFVGCSSSSNETTIVGYENIEPIKVTVGDTFTTPTITAKLSDGTTKTVSNHVVYKKADYEALELDDDDKYTKAGEFEVHVYHLEEKEGYEIGTWTITVQAKK